MRVQNGTLKRKCGRDMKMGRGREEKVWLSYRENEEKNIKLLEKQ